MDLGVLQACMRAWRTQPRAADRWDLLLYGEENESLGLRTTSETEATEILLGLVNYCRDHV
jgi:hypothetical protein